MNLDTIKKNGVVGAGGAGFPTHVKLTANAEYLIMNAAECEPLLHKDKELLLHYTEKVLKGFEIAMQLSGAQYGIIGIKEKYSELIECISQKIKDPVTIQPIGDFYPAGDEVTLIYLTTGRIVQPGALPVSVGCIVQNVETLLNIGMGTPVIDKFITIAGEVSEPLSVKVPIGTTYAEILSKFKITHRNISVWSGGLMMGTLEKDLENVVTKTTGGLILLPSDHYCIQTYERFSSEHNTVRIAKASCDQCNFCTELCPRYLLGHPVRPETAMRNRMFSKEEDTILHTGNAFCCECNLCTFYACPEGLDPKGATVIEKRLSRNSEEKWEGLPVKPHPMAEYRKVPTKKLMQRLDVMKYKNQGPLEDIGLDPQKVRIPLRQHIGAPANPIVHKGDQVERYDLIAEANGNISANIHASITGTVIQINEKEIIIQR